MSRVLVTGADGFVATHLIRMLVRRGDVVFGIGLFDPAPGCAPMTEYRRADAADATTLVALFSAWRPEYIFHLAGTTRGGDLEIYRANLTTTLSVLATAREVLPEAGILVVGSAAEYGNVRPEDLPITEETPRRPRGAYGLSKYAATLAAEDAHRGWGARVVIGRPFNIVGAGISRDLLVGALIDRIATAVVEPSARSVIVGRTDTSRDFIAVEDVVDGFMRMMDAKAWGEEFNLCSATATPISRVCEMLLALSPRALTLESSQALQRSEDTPVSFGSYEKARRVLGFVPTATLERMLRDAWEYRIGPG